MPERKIIILITLLLLYTLYSAHTWLQQPAEQKPEVQESNVLQETVIYKSENVVINETQVQKKKIKKKFPTYLRNTCSILDIFLKRLPIDCKNMDTKSDSPSITVIGITIFLVALALNAILDVIKVKEEERARLKDNPEGYRRHSLAEFANKKSVRRESSKFSLHLFQIAEATPEVEEEDKPRRQRPYTRGESTNSYLSEKTVQGDGNAPYCTGNETPTEAKPSKTPSASKLIGM